MSQMMDWGWNEWLYILIGGLLFLFVVLILFYFLIGNHHKGDNVNNEEDVKIRTQKYRNEPTLKKNMVKPLSSTRFCPNCGEKLDEETSKYCLFCGSII